LRDPLAAPHFERLCTKICEDHFDFAAIVAVDRAGRVEASDAVLQGKAGAGPDLDLVAFGNRDRETGRDGMAPAGGIVTSSAATTSIPAAPALA
jgi:hypothetical protein